MRRLRCLRLGQGGEFIEQIGRSERIPQTLATKLATRRIVGDEESLAAIGARTEDQFDKLGQTARRRGVDQRRILVCNSPRGFRRAYRAQLARSELAEKSVDTASVELTVGCGSQEQGTTCKHQKSHAAQKSHWSLIEACAMGDSSRIVQERRRLLQGFCHRSWRYSAGSPG